MLDPGERVEQDVAAPAEEGQEGEPAPQAPTAEALVRGSELARRWEENSEATCDEEFIDGALRDMGLKFEPRERPAPPPPRGFVVRRPWRGGRAKL
jgi:hypothetical protein